VLSVAPIIALVWFRLSALLEAVVEGEDEDVAVSLGNVRFWP
jgi:hypothetical protein